VSGIASRSNRVVAASDAAAVGAARPLAMPEVHSLRQPMIEVRDIRKEYPTKDGNVLAIEHVSFDVPRGEFLSIVGPSGCGKSTLLKMLASLVEPSGGTIKIDIARDAESVRDTAVVFQDAILFPWRTVLENVELPIEVAKADRRHYRARANELLKLVGLADFENKYPHELSGGMQQRVSLARALIQNPGLLLMDEPFGALDAMTREQMTLELQRIWSASKKTVIFVTHSISEAVFLSDRVFVMSGRPSRIADIIEINAPRPRTLAMLATPEFGAHAERIRKLLSASGDLS
jgi:NitT/TauT family transport system ATP-binding protein